MRNTGRPARAAAILSRLPENMPMAGVEVGVLRGQLSAMLLRARPLLRLVMVDLWAPNQSPEYAATGVYGVHWGSAKFAIRYASAIRNTAFAGVRAKQIKADSVVASAFVPDGSLYFAFIDDDHSTPGCTRSITAWFPKVKPDGWIGGHDYGHSPRFNFGVQEAVHQFFDPRKMPVELDVDGTWFVRI